MSAISVTAAPQGAQPTTAVPVAGGWTARFFVSPNTPATRLMGEPAPRRAGDLGVHAQFSRKLAPNLRLTVDLTNVFDRDTPDATENLLAPAPGRGVQLMLRARF